jgi:hypothetical protein
MIACLVSTTLRDPVPGFADSILGLVGVTLGVTLGVIRVYKAKSDIVMDLVPSDVVVNSILTIACMTSESRNQMVKSIFNYYYGDVSKTSAGELLN